MDKGTIQLDGGTIKRLRQERGWGQGDLAEQADLSKGTVERIERGRSAYLDTARKLADALAVTISDLVPSDQGLSGKAINFALESTDGPSPLSGGNWIPIVIQGMLYRAAAPIQGDALNHAIPKQVPHFGNLQVSATNLQENCDESISDSHKNPSTLEHINPPRGTVSDKLCRCKPGTSQVSSTKGVTYCDGCGLPVNGSSVVVTSMKTPSASHNDATTPEFTILPQAIAKGRMCRCDSTTSQVTNAKEVIYCDDCGLPRESTLSEVTPASSAPTVSQDNLTTLETRQPPQGHVSERLCRCDSRTSQVTSANGVTYCDDCGLPVDSASAKDRLASLDNRTFDRTESEKEIKREIFQSGHSGLHDISAKPQANEQTATTAPLQNVALEACTVCGVIEQWASPSGEIYCNGCGLKIDN